MGTCKQAVWVAGCLAGCLAVGISAHVQGGSGAPVLEHRMATAIHLEDSTTERTSLPLSTFGFDYIAESHLFRFYPLISLDICDLLQMKGI